MNPRLLIVDDEASIRDALAERFRARGFDVECAGDGESALVRLRAGVELCLLDLQLPGTGGIEVLQRLAEEDLSPTVIVLTAHGTVQRAVSALKLGAYDFLEKPVDATLLEESVRRASERVRLLSAERARAVAEPDDEPVVEDPRTQRAFDLARRAAKTTSTVLLLGESGTGKEVVARTIHAWSPRAEAPFVALNCAALPETLLESELFGHEKGAFTGASARKLGRLEAAHGGTLFLDEIGEASASVQVKLLRALQERCFEPVGGQRTIEVDFRLVAATNRNLEEAVREGTFREDLYYRLAVIALELPPLRERPGDVEPLVRRIVAELAAEMGRAGLGVSDAALACLRGHTWPGNVRELRNALERAIVLGDGDAIEPEDLPPEVAGACEGEDDGFHARVAVYRKQVLADALRASGGNQTAAAKTLGLQRTYLARLIKKYGL